MMTRWTGWKASSRSLCATAMKQGALTDGANPNGSQRGIAGICDASRRIVGMMPHPERLFEPALGGSDGRGVLESMSEAVGAAAAS